MGRAMTSYSFDLQGAALTALPSGAMWWADEAMLVVSDLHLGRSERIARLGGALIPPYEVADTLGRLDALVTEYAPRSVICLGDTFDDSAAADLPDGPRLWLARMMAGRRWIWIAGNHDPAPVNVGGEQLAELRLGPLTFRHIAEKGASGEVSGHYHPKLRLAGQARACFLLDESRLILPAFGTYTGGLDARDKALRPLLSNPALAILTGRTARPVPLTY